MQKISIKREQSQAGLSFAEREKFRPQVKNKLLLLLALLMTAATGVWAQSGTPSVKKLTVPDTWTGDMTVFSAADLPSDFAAVGDDVITTFPAPTATGNAVLIYGFSGGETKYVEYANGVQSATDSRDFLRDHIYGYVNIMGYEGVYYTAAASAGYTVSLKDGVKDADKWTITPTEATTTGVAENTEVTLKYTGRLKVKGVTATSDAAPAKEPATVTTAPTGAAVVGVGKTTELVSGGVADGGTLMYAVTTTNTKPTSTAGFSDAVPTAKDITASGKVYVWYYVKADDTHSDSEIAATAIEVPVAIIWDGTNISDLRVMGTRQSYTKEGVTMSGNGDDLEARWRDYGDPTRDGIAFEMMESGGYTFTAPNGKKFTKIEMTVNGPAGWDNANLGSGWAYFEDTMNWIFTVTWTGSAASTVDLLKDADMFNGEYAKSIVFYLSE